MRHLLLIPTLLAAFAFAPAQEPTPKLTEAERLVQQLGSEDFLEREAAAKRLAELGADAIEELRAGSKSDNPERARRSLELLRKAERRVAHDKILTPTLVQLDAKEQPLDAVLADLSKQVQWEIVLGGMKPDQLATKKITLSTGKVAFWEAVLKLCDAADLQISSVGGFVAPGAMPYLGRAKPGVRVAADRNRAVVLEARDGAAKRPFSLNGAVLVEAVPFPKNGVSQPTALLQAWPEPRLQWEATAATKVTLATDATGAKIPAEYTPIPAPDPRATGKRVIFIQNADGTVTAVPDTGLDSPGSLKPNVRQAVIQFKPGDKGLTSAKGLDVSLFAKVRTGMEPLCRIGGLEAGKTASATGNSGVEITILYGTNRDGKLTASVTLVYELKAVTAAGVADDLPGVRGGSGFGNHTIFGLRITDANGKPYTLGLISGTNQLGENARVVRTVELELHPEKEGHGPPANIAFWGTHAKTVEVPVSLKDVPLTGGK
jgi:hypothetical protein